MKTYKQPKLTHFRAMADLNKLRLQPPAALSMAQQFVWHQTVDNLPDDWFAAEQIPMLTAYCGHVARAAQIEAALSGLDPLDDLPEFDKLTKLAAGESAKIAMFARSMRLTQQSRLKAETASSRGAGAASAAAIGRPWDGASFDNELLA
ncbi:hypothetical protein [Rhodoferax sp.]|uniref:hypothetical protein n=1 Tax=Rhodoferax sp. TaxID=50421 RepID=UPI0026104676|nr:hypothetical protein [Rhodoferax sp.]